MANRYFQQFLYSFTKKLTALNGVINIVQAVKATLVTQGVTLTAVVFGTSGNAITFTVTGGATAGAEVVTVVGNAISIQIESGVSSITQVRTAINASSDAAALVLASGTSATAVSTATVLPLAGGIEGVASTTIKGASVARTGVGEYTVTLQDAYYALNSVNLTLEAATAVDLVPQIKSTDVVTAKTIVFRTLAGATATEVAAACKAHFNAFLQNSSAA